MKTSGDVFEKSRFVSSGEIALRGERIPFETVCEDIVLHDAAGDPAVSLFSYAYLRSDVADHVSRPVLFCFNGGPGSSSIWLHEGFFGPWRVKMPDEMRPAAVPPFELEENPHSLLDILDIVILDAPATGYGRLIKPASSAEFFGTEQDAQAMAEAIEDWLQRNGRMNSPKYLAGESYGTLRSALLASVLMGDIASSAHRLICVPLDGIVFLGTTFSYRRDGVRTDPVPQETLLLPTLAATHWYHSDAEDKGELRAFVEEAWRFAGDGYLKALFHGRSLPAGERLGVAEELSRLIGLPVKKLLKNDLHIDPWDYVRELLEDAGEVVGFYDSRYRLPDSRQLGEYDVIADDAAMGLYSAAYRGAWEAELKGRLGITFGRTYQMMFYTPNLEWDKPKEGEYKAPKPPRTPGESLVAAMRRNPKMRVFFGSGLYDMATVAGGVRYLCGQLDLPPERVTVREYETGHMLYLGECGSEPLEKDLRAFFEGR